MISLINHIIFHENIYLNTILKGSNLGKFYFRMKVYIYNKLKRNKLRIFFLENLLKTNEIFKI